MEKLAASVVGAIINTINNQLLSVNSTVCMQSWNKFAYISSVFFEVGNIDYKTTKMLLIQEKGQRNKLKREGLEHLGIFISFSCLTAILPKTYTAMHIVTKFILHLKKTLE